MKYFLPAALMIVLAAPVSAADIGVSVSVSQPGLYGRIDIGKFPQPQLIFPTPMIIQPVPQGVVHQPLYLHVPPGHAKNWRKHCRKYNACGQPVYFVQEDWYNNEYAPHHGENQDQDNHDDHGKDKHKHKEKHKGKHGKD